MKRRMILALWLGVHVHALPVQAADWPTYMHDAARSGTTAEALVPPLTQTWVYRPRHAPRPAWPPPVGWFPARTAYDRAYHAVVSGGSVYFGSSADDKVTCLDAATGRERWSVFTEGPVRLAPTVWRGRVYVGSDDGWVYCLDARDGHVRWKFHAAPTPRRVLGAGRMMSPWPVRTSVLVDRGIAYFAAGLFPSQSVFVYAVRAEDGRLVWRNDTCGQRYVYLPHGGAEGFSGLAPQGALLASRDRLYVPTGRSVPAALDRRDGRLVFWESATKRKGGVYALLCDDVLLSGTKGVTGYDSQTGKDVFACYPGRRIVVTAERAYLLTRQSLAAVDRQAHTRLARREKALNDKRLPVFYRHRSLEAKLGALRKKRAPATQPSRQEQTWAAQVAKYAATLAPLDEELKRVRKGLSACVKWQCRTPGACSLVLAGGVLYTGGSGAVCAVDAATGKPLWNGKVEGKAYGLAVADGRLLVSTDNGTITCFAKAGAGAKPGRGGDTAPGATPSPYPTDTLSPVYAATAEAIVKQTGITKGYCLVLGCDTGRLAYELAQRTQLTICGVDEDAGAVATARRALDRGRAVRHARVGHPGVPRPASVRQLLREPGGVGSGVGQRQAVRVGQGDAPGAETAGWHGVAGPAGRGHPGAQTPGPVRPAPLAGRHPVGPTAG